MGDGPLDLVLVPGWVSQVEAMWDEPTHEAFLRRLASFSHRTGDFDIDVGGSRYIAEQIPGAKYVELPGRDHLLFVGDTEAILAEIEEFLTGVRGAGEFDRVLAIVMITDIAESTKIAADLSDSRWRALIESHNALVRRELDLHRGREVDSAGDGFLAHFDGPARAIRCASAIVDGAARLGSPGRRPHR